MDLVKFDEMSRQIAEAKDIQTLSLLSDQLEAIRIMARQTKQSLETQNKIAEYRLRVERKKGDWLKENIQHQGGTIDPIDRTKLKDIGISKDESSKSQKIADLTEKQFEEYIEETKDTNQEVTLAGAVRLAKQIIREDKIEEQKEELEKSPPKMPDGKFSVIVIDPPWKYDTKYSPESPMARVTVPYPEMSQEELFKLKIPAKDDCIMWLWTTNAFMKDAYELLENWGFAPKTILTWDKINIGVGYWLRNITEHCILAVRGSPVWDNKTYSTIIHEKKTKHSRKPEGFYDMVNDICYGNKLDYFARNKREGWAVFGDEVKDGNL